MYSSRSKFSEPLLEELARLVARPRWSELPCFGGRGGGSRGGRGGAEDPRVRVLGGKGGTTSGNLCSSQPSGWSLAIVSQYKL